MSGQVCEGPLSETQKDFLSRLDGEVKKSFKSSGGSIFASREKAELKIIDSPEKDEQSGFCRLLMTQLLDPLTSAPSPESGEQKPGQLLFIGINPSLASRFVETGSKGDKNYPETDKTSRLVYGWLEKGVYKDLGPLGRITMLNLVPVIDPDSGNVKRLLKKLDAEDFFVQILHTLVTSVVENYLGKTHVVRMWGKSEGGGMDWKVPYIRCLERGDSSGPGFKESRLDSVWDFGIGQLGYPPHPLRVNGVYVPGLIEAYR